MSQKITHMVGFTISGTAWCAAVVINESTGFSLGVIFAVFGGVWWLGRKLQNLEDRMTEAQEWRVEVKKTLTKSETEREQILHLIARLPCQTTTTCEIKTIKK